MPKNIKYLAYFDFSDSKIKRNYAISAATKIEYIAGAFISNGYNVELISASSALETKLKWYCAEKIRKNDSLTACFLPTFGCRSRILIKLRNLFALISLFSCLLFKIRRNDTIIAYHSLGFRNTLLWLKKIRKFNLILEVEEIYQDVTEYSGYFKNLEYKMFDLADGYLFSTELLDPKLNKENKPFAVCYGTYNVEDVITSKFSDGKIHVVYAGTFDPRKGGAISAIKSAEFLPGNYHMHILGFGDEKDTEFVKNTISEISCKTNAEITFEGLYKGREYIEFLQKCHIGLSTQNPDAAFNATSFPSKILSYMANGLSVVSIRIDVIEQSAVNDYMEYYDTQTPENIAHAIRNTDLTRDNRAIITTLDSQFKDQIKKLQ